MTNDLDSPRVLSFLEAQTLHLGYLLH